MHDRLRAMSRLLLPLVLAFAAGPAFAQDFNQFFVFGDSNVDSGYYRSLASPGGGALFNSLWPNAVLYGAGKPTTSPGLMSSEALAALFGLNALPANVPGGTNYATSGAKNDTVNTTVNGGFQAAVPTVTQIANYLAAFGGRANPDALYLISSGANDVSFATANSGTGPYPVDPAAYLLGAADSLANAVAQLQAAGARYIIVRGLPYSFPTGASLANATTRADRLLYTQALWSDLAARGVNFIPSDYNAARLAIAANPALFGFAFIDNTTNYACTKPAGINTAWALLCSSNPAAPSTFVTPDADQTRLFADDQHLTTAGQKIVADYEYSLVVAPSQISFLAEVPVKTRASFVAAIFNQIPLSFSQLAPFHGWASGDIASLKMDNYSGFPTDPGTPAAISAGFDYRLSAQWLVGAAFSLGTTRQTFSLGGDFKQDEFAVSAYAAFRNAPYWFNAVATWGTLRYDIDRQVPIGITVQSNVGGTKGTNISFAAETGYDFVLPLNGSPNGPPGAKLTHGPLIGIVLQRVDVNGFTETDAFAAIGGFTALSFADQTRNSAVTELGYQASIDFGMWQPYVKVAWNHELVDDNRQVTAALTTIAAPSYAMPAVQLGRDWGTGVAGTRVKLGPDVAAYAALLGTIGQNKVVDYGAQVGVNVAFGPQS